MTTTAFGKSIKLFLVDGTTSGLWSAEVSASWTGRMFRVSKATFDSLNEFEDASGPGVYFLIGDVEANHMRQLYIGESDNVLNRLLQHEAKGEKTFWKDTVLVVSKDENLTKAHTLYLESRLIDIVKKAGQVSLNNGTNPIKSLPRPDQSDMEYFIEQILLMMPVMGYSFLTPIPPVPQDVTPQNYPQFDFAVSDVKAAMELRGDDFVVLTGSEACGTVKPSLNEGYAAMRTKLVENGTLVKQPGKENYTFSQEASFPSASRAAVVVYGGNISGPKYWRLKGTNQTYGEWLEAQARMSIPEAPSSTDTAEATPPAVEPAAPVMGQQQGLT
jgi:predicted GIY-YIG superfamily endonuclease